MVMAIFNALLDLANIVAASVMVLGIRMSWGSKVFVFTLFSMRLLYSLSIHDYTVLR